MVAEWQRQNKFRKLNKAALLKKAAGDLWRKLDGDEKQIYVEQSKQHEERSRDQAGRFERVCKSVDAEMLADVAAAEVEAEIPADGGAAAVDTDEIASVVSEDTEMRTPRKKAAGSHKGLAAAHLLSAFEAKIASSDTPDKFKQNLKELVREASAQSAQAKQYFKEAHMVCRVPLKPASRLGRPSGACLISDDDLVEALQDHSAETSLMHMQSQKPVRTLLMSKTRAARACGKLGRSQFCLRMKKQRLGFAPATCQRGKCDSCHAWQLGGRKQLVGLLKETRTLIKAKLPQYFEKWDEANKLHDSYELEAADSVEYLQSCLALLEDREHMAEARSLLSDEDKMLLEGYEQVAVDGLRNLMVDVQNYSFHLQLKHSMQVSWSASWEKPSAGTCYMLWDHMAR